MESCWKVALISIANPDVSFSRRNRIKGVASGNETRVLSRNWLSPLSPASFFTIYVRMRVHVYSQLDFSFFRVRFLKLFARKAKLPDNAYHPLHPLATPASHLVQKSVRFLLVFPSLLSHACDVKSAWKARAERGELTGLVYKLVCRKNYRSPPLLFFFPVLFVRKNEAQCLHE